MSEGAVNAPALGQTKDYICINGIIDFLNSFERKNIIDLFDDHD